MSRLYYSRRKGAVVPALKSNDPQSGCDDGKWAETTSSRTNEEFLSLSRHDMQNTPWINPGRCDDHLPSCPESSVRTRTHVS